MERPDETRGQAESGFDSAIADFGEFAVSWARTWGLLLFRPHRAADLLLAD